MSGVWERVGVANREGQRWGTLVILRMVSRHPVRWLIRCLRCGCEWAEANERLQVGGLLCRNSVCFKAQESERRC